MGALPYIVGLALVGLILFSMFMQADHDDVPVSGDFKVDGNITTRGRPSGGQTRQQER